MKPNEANRRKPLCRKIVLLSGIGILGMGVLLSSVLSEDKPAMAIEVLKRERHAEGDVVVFKLKSRLRSQIRLFDEDQISADGQLLTAHWVSGMPPYTNFAKAIELSVVSPTNHIWRYRLRASWTPGISQNIKDTISALKALSLTELKDAWTERWFESELVESELITNALSKP